MIAVSTETRRRLADRIPLSVYQRLGANDPVGLLYHTIAPEPLPHVRHLYTHKTPAQLVHDIDYLARSYDLCGVQDLASPRRGKPRAYISFDDGMIGCHDVVRDILLRHGIPAVFFIATGFIDNRRLFYRHKVSLCIDAVDARNSADRQSSLAEFGRTRAGAPLDRPGFIRWIDALRWPDEPQIDDACAFFGVDIEDYLRSHRPYMTAAHLRTLVRDGFDIGAHTVTHPNLAHIPASQAEHEIEQSCRYVAELSGLDRVPFAIPFSSEGIDQGWLQALHPRIPLLNMVFDSSGLTHTSFPLTLNRLWVDRAPANGNTTGLPELLQRAYARAFTM